MLRQQGLGLPVRRKFGDGDRLNRAPLGNYSGRMIFQNLRFQSPVFVGLVLVQCGLRLLQ